MKAKKQSYLLSFSTLWFLSFATLAPDLDLLDSDLFLVIMEVYVCFWLDIAEFMFISCF